MEHQLLSTRTIPQYQSQVQSLEQAIAELIEEKSSPSSDDRPNVKVRKLKDCVYKQ